MLLSDLRRLQVQTKKLLAKAGLFQHDGDTCELSLQFRNSFSALIDTYRVGLQQVVAKGPPARIFRILGDNKLNTADLSDDVQTFHYYSTVF